MDIKISASLLSANFLILGEEIRNSEEAGVDSFHLDVMDGHLAPNLSYGPPVIEWIRKATQRPLETHLMIDNPRRFLDDYIRLGVNSLFIHAEAYDTKSNNPLHIKTSPRYCKEIRLDELIKDLTYIRSKGLEAGLTLNPGTPVSTIEHALPHCDSILIMSVNPGYSGQKFIPETLEKIPPLRSKFKGQIKIDGGITDKTAPAAIKAGVTTLITASYLYNSPNYKEAVTTLKTYKET